MITVVISMIIGTFLHQSSTSLLTGGVYQVGSGRQTQHMLSYLWRLELESKAVCHSLPELI